MPSNSQVRYGSLQHALYIGIDDLVANPLVRIVILFEDLRIDWESVSRPHTDESAIQYAAFYAARRSWVTLREFQLAIEELDLQPRFQDLLKTWDAQTQATWNKLKAQLKDSKVKDLRDSIGGHIGTTTVRDALQKVERWDGVGRIEITESDIDVAHLAISCLGAIFDDNSPSAGFKDVSKTRQHAIDEWAKAYKAATALACMVLEGIIWPRLK